MRVLLLGGTRFLGRELAWRLLAAGHAVTLFNRGRIADPFPANVSRHIERLVGDRGTDDLARVIGGRTFDAVVDFCGYTADDARRAVNELAGRVGQLLFISSGQVYLVRSGCPRPARESDYDGPLLDEPRGEHDRDEWAYGIGKRQAEDALDAAYRDHGFPATRLRLPMVHGPGDYYRRVESYLWRLVDGGPIALPDGGDAPMRHVSSAAVSRLIVRLIEEQRGIGHAWNIAQEETPSLREVVLELAGLIGARPRLVDVPSSRLVAEGLEPVDVSPLSGRWMSFIDPSLARRELGFAHEPLAAVLAPIVATFLAHPPAQAPPGYAQRDREIAILDQVGMHAALGD